MERTVRRSDAPELLRFDQGGALLRKVIESAAVGMVLIGVEGHVLYANAAFAGILGLGVEDVLATPPDAFIHPQCTAAMPLQLNRMLAGELDEYRCECRLRHADGSAVWVLAVASLLRSDKTGLPLYLIVQTTNIDRQKRAEEALIYTERRWNSALEASGQGVWDHDIRNDDMFYSRTWRTMRGMAPDEAVDPRQSEWLKRVHPDDVPRILAVVDKQDKGEDGFDTLEYRERHRDGRWIWILSRGRPVEWDAKGRAVRTIGTDTDITLLKTVTALLDAERERLTVTLQSIGDGVISTDRRRRVTFMNPVAERMTGWTTSEAMGQPVETVFPLVDEGTGRPAPSPVIRCLADGVASYLDADVALESRTGERRDIRASAAPLHTGDGTVIGSVLVFQDMTASRSLQRELAHSATHDALTGLPNRVAFERALATVVRDAVEESRRHALCFIDLDHFKPVNDGAGHAAGDALLREVARLIRANCRRQDFSARIGGDEFALLLADCPLPHAQRIARRLVTAISALPFSMGGADYRIGASVGIAEIGLDLATPDELMRRADAACYAAKAGGRGRVAVHGSATGQPD